ncbi:uncharacterized protein MKZ38_007806 [Zalerion maritima]|uniref:DNA mismatch repair protein n=1 Tax=Zalerion maritima TaxID=339359 RepID=A0AAD5RHM0_9PEZI|nr:uncharacterized protein MKZ38_007806 [Zalerion maritima]
MGGEKTTLPSRTPAKTPVSNKKIGTGSVSASTGKQQSILGFFARQTPSSQSQSQESWTPTSTAPKSAAPHRHATTDIPSSSPCLQESKKSMNELPPLPHKQTTFKATTKRSSNITPVPTSDIAEPPSSQENNTDRIMAKIVTSKAVLDSSPTRKGNNKINYAESTDDDEDELPVASKPRRRLTQRSQRSKVLGDDEDEFEAPKEPLADDDEDMDDFIVSDESDAPTRKRKRANTKGSRPTKRANLSSSPEKNTEKADSSMSDNIPTNGTSTAHQWIFDPDNIIPATELLKPATSKKPKASRPKAKEKAHTKDPDQRYPWLAKIQDKNHNSPGDEDYDPSSVFVPRSAWNDFSPFETQYWEIKQNLWDTVVFFKKGKFYELYENDATIGHQLFDLKLTDRVNMRMVGVPESSLDMWVNQFVAKGYKVARVDQMESALGKEMRERGGTGPKGKDKIIRRELACILTGGTLVDGAMLQDDMAVFCVSIKEQIVDGLPSFGIAFVDAATGQFFLSQWTDDAEFTKFETFVAQTNPGELILERGCISAKALRILKSNVSPLTIWNYKRSGTEFWDAEKTRVVLDGAEYFVREGHEEEEPVWPEVLQEAKDKELVMSAFGGLTKYLALLKIDKALISQANFQWYSPIVRNGTLVLDGQTLINLEIFANNVDGGPEGTLFQLLNRCVTPFGKRLFRQWVCHPLCNIPVINERLDAVEMLLNDPSICGQFSSSMTKMPDLERLISRIHAGVCKPEDFVKVLDGFEQIEYTASLLSAYQGGCALIDRLLKAMPNLQEPLNYWKSAFVRKKALEEKLLVPVMGIDDDFDESIALIDDIKERLHALLKKKSGELKCKNLKFTDIGKEIYQIEAPKSVKVPKEWKQMSATNSVKRYYFTKLTDLVRELQEAEETHGQLLKEIRLRFFKRFDEDYEKWIQAIRCMAQLDCLVGLAKASSSLGAPSCRPEFVDEEESTMEFEALRHPCMESAVDDFIPNDIVLGGATDEGEVRPKINLLTGANAAGKSTVLRMSCIAVIMAQIGCHVPAQSARLTPVDRIMSRLGANDNIFAAQSTFFVELSETKKILGEATPRSLVILDELGRGTSSYDGVAVAQAVLHHVATHVGCLGFFATHYHSLASEFQYHPSIREKRMKIHVDDANRQITFLYKLEDGVAEGSFGMHCASMCGIPSKIVEGAEKAAREWEYTSRLKESLERRRERGTDWLPLGVVSDLVGVLKGGNSDEENGGERNNGGTSLDGALEGLLKGIEAL